MKTVGIYLIVLLCLPILAVLWIKRKLGFREYEESEVNEFWQK